MGAEQLQVFPIAATERVGQLRRRCAPRAAGGVGGDSRRFHAAHDTGKKLSQKQIFVFCDLVASPPILKPTDDRGRL